MNDTTKKSAVEEITDEEIIEARRAYQRARQAEWRKKNPEKVAAIQRRFYEKKRRELAQKGGAVNGE